MSGARQTCQKYKNQTKTKEKKPKLSPEEYVYTEESGLQPEYSLALVSEVGRGRGMEHCCSKKLQRKEDTDRILELPAQILSYIKDNKRIYNGVCSFVD